MTTIDPASVEDDRLMERMAEDDSAALEALMERWQGAVFRFIGRGVRDQDLAEELTQETFWRVWRARRQYRPGGRFSTWLFRIASRLCLDQYRRAGRRPRLQDDHALLTAPAPTRDHADEVARSNELQQALERSLAKLPAKQRLALQLNRFDGMSCQEVADVLECSVGSVEQLIFRARRKLREDLADFMRP